MYTTATTAFTIVILHIAHIVGKRLKAVMEATVSTEFSYARTTKFVRGIRLYAVAEAGNSTRNSFCAFANYTADVKCAYRTYLCGP